MDALLIVAGSLELLAAAIHGAGGEMLVVRKLSAQALPASSFGGPRMTRTMIHVTWHITTVAFFSVGCALLLAGSALDGDAAEALAVGGAAAASGFGAVALGIGAAGTRTPRAIVRHPGPLVLTLAAVLAWWGALSA